MWKEVGVVAWYGGMWQGVGACGRGNVCGRGSAYIDGDMWQGVGSRGTPTCPLWTSIGQVKFFTCSPFPCR